METRHSTTKTGHKVYRPALHDHYNVFSPDDVYMGIILHKSELPAFIEAGGNIKPITKE